MTGTHTRWPRDMSYLESRRDSTLPPREYTQRDCFDVIEHIRDVICDDIAPLLQQHSPCVIECRDARLVVIPGSPGGLH